MDPEALVSAGADVLFPIARKFYEDTRLKMLLSIVYGGLFLMYLGFSATAGGKSLNFSLQYKNTLATYGFNDDHMMMSVEALIGGYGFASFCFLVSSLLCLSAAIIISPLISG